MSDTIVVNSRKNKYDVYIGRPSIWGNPYTDVMNHKTLAQYIVANREEAIQKYETYIREKLEKDPELKKELLELKGKRLGCWCKPKACHGDVLVKLIEEFS